MRRGGVLVGTTGRERNTIKVRPPLAFTSEHVPRFADELAAALSETA
jgi:4-aminobutyrate aminotransferase-like enzyme